MERTRFKIELWQMLFVGVASAFAVVILNSLSFGLSAERLVDSLTHTFFIASMVSIGILYLAPRIQDLSTVKRICILVPVIFAMTMIGIVMARTFLSLFDINLFDYFDVIPGPRTVLFSLLISHVFGLGGYIYLHSQHKLNRTRELLRQKELDEAKAKSLAVSAQLASLESKIHPHFLFNTLNSIAALINEKPDQAENMIEKLSALLRYSLDFEPNKMVTLAEELKITLDYLEIESTRFGDKLDYDFEIKPELEDKKIPAFAIQTLVENSIKHVVAKNSSKSKIHVSAKNSHGILKIEVADNGSGFSNEEIKGGHGLDTLRKRLANIFGNDAKLETNQDETGGRISLQIPV
ncbi:MAG: histidine kinase [Pyrinomonadaceae bacterium]|nr:histidine kinase [Pyrinomonadaceae bacterium]